MSARAATNKAPRKVKAAKKSAGAGGARAAAAVKRAKDAGALGPGGTQAQRALRDAAIMAGLIAERTQAEVASELGISARTVREVKARAGKRPSILKKLPMDIVEELLAALREDIASFQAMAYAHADANPSVAVAAKKGAMQARERLIEMLLALNVLPQNLSIFRSESIVRQIATEMVSTMGKAERGEITIQEAHAHFLSVIDADKQRQLGAAA